MKVLMLNGSPHEKGCTYTALSVIKAELQVQGIETEIIWVGNKPVQGCIGCWRCKENASHCVFKDQVNDLIEKMEGADGLILGSPVQFASAAGSFTAILDRFFVAGSKALAYKPAAVVCSARRAGTTSTFNQLMSYLTMNNMVIVPSPYWNMVHGSKPEEVLHDEEGIYIMKSVASGMAWLLKVLAAGKNIKIVQQISAKTNFIH